MKIKVVLKTPEEFSGNEERANDHCERYDKCGRTRANFHLVAVALFFTYCRSPLASWAVRTLRTPAVRPAILSAAALCALWRSSSFATFRIAKLWCRRIDVFFAFCRCSLAKVFRSNIALLTDK